MRVLSVVPRYAVTVGSLNARRGGTVIGKTREEGGKLQFEFTPFMHCLEIKNRDIEMKNKETPLEQQP